MKLDIVDKIILGVLFIISLMFLTIMLMSVQHSQKLDETNKLIDSLQMYHEMDGL